MRAPRPRSGAAHVNPTPSRPSRQPVIRCPGPPFAGLHFVSLNHMKISLLHATARRDEAVRCVERWYGEASGDVHVEHLLCFDFDVPVTVRDDLLSRCRSASRGKTILALPTGRRHSVEAWNHCAKSATGDVLVQLSDDMLPDRHWDRKVLEYLDVEKPQLLGFAPASSYGDQGGLIALAIMTRPYYEQLGYFLYPIYPSVFSDNDLTQTAMLDDVLIDAYGKFSVLHDHDHHRDEVVRNQNSREKWFIGHNIFQARKDVGFPSIRYRRYTNEPVDRLQAFHMFAEGRYAVYEKRNPDPDLREKYAQYNGGRMNIEW